MTVFKLTSALAAVPFFVLAACFGDVDDPQLPGGPDSMDDLSLEQELHLVPQLLRATDIPEGGKVLTESAPSYLILSAAAGEINLDAITIVNAPGEARGLVELLGIPESARSGLVERDMLLMLAVPGQRAEALCNRFQFGHEEIDLVKLEGQHLLYQVPGADGQVHALCLLPPSVAPNSKGSGQGTSGTQNYGGGSYTARIKTLKCNGPRDWEYWPYDGDESRMRGFYDGYGGAQLWGSDNVKSGRSYAIGRYVHFNSYAQIELFDYDSAPWNASDKLGTSWIYSDSACLGDRYADFDGSGGGHNWNYDMTFQVYGPNCPCQSQEPAIYQTSQSETCSVTATTITSYSYYCSGGIYWQQAWGNRTRHCDSYNNTYNIACEMQTYVSSSLVTACDHYETSIPLGSPVEYGYCSSSYCGDGICNGSETPSTCPNDCGSSCNGTNFQQCQIDLPE